MIKNFDKKTSSDEKPYEPDCVMAFMLASAKEARAIPIRMMPLASKIILAIGFCVAL